MSLESWKHRFHLELLTKFTFFNNRFRFFLSLLNLILFSLLQIGQNDTGKLKIYKKKKLKTKFFKNNSKRV